MCASSRKCENNQEMFGMLCKRRYDKPIIVKFEKQCTYYKNKSRRRRKSRCHSNSTVRNKS